MANGREDYCADQGHNIRRRWWRCICKSNLRRTLEASIQAIWTGSLRKRQPYIRWHAGGKSLGEGFAPRNPHGIVELRASETVGDSHDLILLVRRLNPGADAPGSRTLFLRPVQRATGFLTKFRGSKSLRNRPQKAMVCPNQATVCPTLQVGGVGASTLRRPGNRRSSAVVSNSTVAPAMHIIRRRRI